MDIFDQELMRSCKSSTFSASDLSSMGKQASNRYLSGLESLNSTIVKLAREHAGMTAHHVQRVVECANNHTFQAIFEKQAGDKNIVFDLADPREVLRSLDFDARPAVSRTSFDYGTDPTKLASGAREVEIDVQLLQEFGLEPHSKTLDKIAAKAKDAGQARKQLVKEATDFVKIGSAQSSVVLEDLRAATSVDFIKRATASKGSYPEANPFGDLVRTRQQLVKLSEDLQRSRDTNRQMLKEATEKFSAELKQHLLNGGSFGDAVQAVETVDPQGQRVKEAMAIAVSYLQKHGLDLSKSRVDLINHEMKKHASRTVNPSNPLVVSFAAITKLASGQEHLDANFKAISGLLTKVSAALSAAALGRPITKTAEDTVDTTTPEAESTGEDLDEDDKLKLREKVVSTPGMSDDEFHDFAVSEGVDPDAAEEVIYEALRNAEGGDAEAGDLIPGGLAEGSEPEDYSPGQMTMGEDVEMEHTDNPEVAKEIATDHLEEIPDYYDRLAAMEAEAKAEGAEKEEKTAASVPGAAAAGTKSAWQLMKENLKGNTMQAVTATLPTYAVLAAASGGIQSATGGIRDLFNAVLDKRRTEARFNEMMEKNPMLQEYSPEQVRATFNTLNKFSPEYAADPLVAGNFVKTQVDADRMDLSTVNALVQGHRHMQEAGGKGKDTGVDVRTLLSMHTTPAQLAETDLRTNAIMAKMDQEAAQHAARMTSGMQQDLRAQELFERRVMTADEQTERSRAQHALEVAQSQAQLTRMAEERAAKQQAHGQEEVLRNITTADQEIKMYNEALKFYRTTGKMPPQLPAGDAARLLSLIP